MDSGALGFHYSIGKAYRKKRKIMISLYKWDIYPLNWRNPGNLAT